MPDSIFEYAIIAIIVGIVATAIFDVYLAFIQPRLFKSPFTGFAMMGRWFGYFPRGRFKHDNIAKSDPVAHEAALGWIVHYAVGILFAGILVVVWGDWLRAPTLGPALIVGIGTLVAPFCLTMPAFGMGFFASRTPNPRQACLRAFVSHTVFGIGLYLAGLLVSMFVI